MKKGQEIKLGLTYDDVLLVPQYSEIESRHLVNIKSNLSKNITVNVPIISANMDTVTESKMAIAMALSGGIGFIHRFSTIEYQVGEIVKVKEVKFDKNVNPLASIDKNGKLLVGAAIGLKEGTARAEALVEAGVNLLVIDIAHGHYGKCIEFLKALKKQFKTIDIIAGNVATAEGALDLIKAGADAVKVGIGAGSACSTRIISGSGVPQFTAVLDAAEIGHKYNVPIIADAGIKYPGDVAKAIGAGASTVMIGNLFAGCLETPGEVFNENGESFKTYRGMASQEASEARKKIELGSNRSNRAAEGISFKVTYKGEVTPVIQKLVDGLQSGMSYSGASDIEIFWKKSQFIQTTASGLNESFPRSYQI